MRMNYSNDDVITLRALLAAAAGFVSALVAFATIYTLTSASYGTFSIILGGIVAINALIIVTTFVVMILEYFFDS